MPTVEFEIAPGKYVGGKHPCFIIAEIGQNHQGNVELAKALIQIAADCGVDCVKFQKTDLLSRFTAEVLKRPYEGEHVWGSTYGEHRKYLELAGEDFVELKKFSTDLGLCFAASGMDKPSTDFLNSLGVPFFKIGSADTTNLPLLKHLCRYNKPLVISTGMTTEADVCKMYDEVSKESQQIALLQCTSCYPTPPHNVNLNVMKAYKDLFPEAVIGYSGHEKGIGISLAAVASGAKILERHITLDHSYKGSDHKSSLEPQELKNLVDGIRRIEKAMGSNKKEFQECEKPCFEKLGKTIVASRFLESGTFLDEDAMDVKVSVKKGYDPINYYDLIGKQLKTEVEKDEAILSVHLA
ncbi:Sialic acid synthase [Araneus ventricosus]|uniref:Sialic acid synthase n=1 Tax=Araneus ventricosus TaxID=182803 RepID=A0A4Y2HBA2_ARAVE|nr:Sialic acid synthase [Araneus ventricosus]